MTWYRGINSVLGDRYNPDSDDVGIDFESKNFNKHYHGQEPDTKVLRTDNYRNRVLFVKYGCEFCEKWVNVVSRFNNKLDRRSRTIEVQDINYPSPLREKLQPNGAPTLFIDGIVVKGVTSQGFAEGFLEGFLEDEMVID